MISIKVLGPGCSKCKVLEQAVRDVVSENNIDAEVKKVDDIMEIMNYGVISTPGIVINEKLALSGRVPSKEEINELIKKHGYN